MVGGRPGIGPRTGIVAGATPRVERGIISAERRAPSAERRAPSAERRAPSAERRAPSAERRAPSAERRAPSAERRAPSAERRATSPSPAGARGQASGSRSLRECFRRLAVPFLLALSALAFAPAAEAQDRPATPTGFTATQSASGVGIELRWDADTDPVEPGESITGFRIDWRPSVAGSDWVANPPTGMKTINNGTIVNIAITDTQDSLQPDTEYDFRIRSMRSGSAPTNSWFSGKVTERTASRASVSIATDPSPLTEADLDGARLTLDLVGVEYISSLSPGSFTMPGVLSGLSIASVNRVSNTRAVLTLAFNGDFAGVQQFLTIHVPPGSHTGTFTLLAAPVTVTPRPPPPGPAPAAPAARVVTDPPRLTEDNADDATVTLRLAGATWEDPIPTNGVTVTGLPDGMEASEPARVSDSEARITLSYTPEGADGLEGDAVLTVTAAAASHSGPAALTGTVTVHARSAPAALAATRWLSRFGRTVADHVMAAVGARLSEPAGQDDRLRLAGRSLYSPAALLNPPPARREGSGEGLAACAAACGASPAAALDAANVANGGVGAAGLAAGPLTRPLPAGGERGIAAAQALTPRDLLAGTSFRVSAAGGGGVANAGWTAWGRVDLSRFDEDEGGLSLDGDTMTATVGADMRRGRLLAGVAAAHSAGSGEYRDVGGAAGDLDASLASVHPYVRVEAAGGLSLWGVLGWGGGDMTLDRRDGDDEKADLEMTMAGAGARGPLPAPSAGMALALRAEAFGSRIEADGGGDALKGAEAEAWRMRLALEASWDETEAGLRPSAELGLRHDGGDGETGTGAELGGGVAWAGPDGLSASLRARALLDGDGVSEWGGGAMLAYAPGADGRGLRLSLAPSVGAAEGGVERLWRADAAALAGERDARPRLDAKAGYGIAVMGGRGLLTPHAGLSLSDADDRRTRLGARLTLAPGADLALAAERTDRTAGPEHALTLGARLRW